MLNKVKKYLGIEGGYWSTFFVILVTFYSLVIAVCTVGLIINGIKSLF